jgi:hypothetical protein
MAGDTQRPGGRDGGRPRLGRFRRPRWRDPAFAAAVGLTAVAFAIQVALVPDRSGWLVGLALGVRLVVTWLVISALIRIRVGVERGLVAGFTEAETAAEDAAAAEVTAEGRTRPGRPGRSSAESVARSGGRLAGRALRAYRSDGRRRPN